MPRTLALIASSLVAVGLFVRAADPPATGPSDEELQKAKQKAAFEQERLRRTFGDFQRSLLALAQRYEKSSKSEDREKALVLRQAIELSTKEGIDNQFNRLVVTLTGSGITLQEINAAIGQNEQLAKTLRELINVLLTDNQTAKLKEEQKRLQDLLKDLDKVLRQQKLERANTEAGRLDPKDLAKGQQKVTADTKKLSKQMGNAEPKDGKAKGQPKGEAKPEGKNGKPEGEGKDDTKDPKGDAKKAGDPKDAKGDPKGGDPKGDPKDAKGDPKGGDPKDAKGDPKDAGEAKGPPKDMPEPGEAKGKPDGQQPKDAADNKAKPEGKGEAKPGDPKDQKSDPQKGDAKPSDSKDQKGNPKGEGKPPQGQPQEGDPQEGGDPSKPQQQPQQPEDEGPPGRKQVKDAIENQKQAEKNLEKKDRDKASGDQDEAIKNLEEVRKEIEKRLKQLREEEMERLLRNLESRCSNMLTMQLDVYEATKRIHATVRATEGKVPARAEVLKAGEQSDREALIVTEANKALQLLEEDGSAVAIPQVLENARDDMVKVKDRLFKTDVGQFTQGIEEDIIAALKEVVEALKKAQQDLKDKKDQQQQPPPPGGGERPPQRLIDILAELRMLKSLQLQVNKRTTNYGRQYPGEQADEPDIIKELRNLAGRQMKIEKATKDIATGKAGNNQ